MVTPEDIERLESELGRHRKARVNGLVVPEITVSAGSHSRLSESQLQPQIIRQSMKIHGKSAELIATPEQLVGLTPGGTLASRVRVELIRPDCDSQCRTVEFTPPARIEGGDILVKDPGGNRGRKRVEEWVLLDPLLFFSGKKEDTRRLKALGALFI